MPEVNLGQIALEVERCARGEAEVVRVSHAGGGVHQPEAIYDAVVEVMS